MNILPLAIKLLPSRSGNEQDSMWIKVFLLGWSLLFASCLGESSFANTPVSNSEKVTETVAPPTKAPSTSSVKENVSVKKLLCQRLLKRTKSKRLFYLQLSSRGSNLKRFHILDLKKCAIVESSLVTHGILDAAGEICFSNTPGSNCSSKGLAKIGKKYVGMWGTAYRLHGLDKTNSKMRKRAVVLHYHECVPEDEVDYDICESLGCPTVNPEFFKSLENWIDNEKVNYMYIE